MTTTIFTEAIDLAEAQLDSANRTLRNVVLIRAGESKNRRDYPASVLEAAATVFEGVKAYADHPSRSDLRERAERSIRDITGWYTNVRFDGEALRADRIFANTQAGRDALAIAEDIVSGVAPKGGAGLSINAVGKARKREDGGLVVEAITHAHSVDDVTTPAAGGTYIESVTGDDLTTALIEALTYDEWVSLRPDFTERFEKAHRKTRWNAELKEAKRQLGEYAARCEQLEAENAALQEARDTAQALAEGKAREVLVLRAMASVRLPAAWKQSLEQELLEADPGKWDSIIQRNLDKAKAAGAAQRVEVTGAGPQTAPSTKIEVTESTAPRDDEDAIAYAKRLHTMRR